MDENGESWYFLDGDFNILPHLPEDNTHTALFCAFFFHERHERVVWPEYRYTNRFLTFLFSMSKLKG